MKRLVALRRLSQVVSFGVFFYVLYFTTYPLESKLPVSSLFTRDPLLMVITSISERLVLSGIAASLVSCLLAAILGRFFCGWFCPLGAMFDFCRSRYPGRKSAGALPRRAYRVKFGILAVLFLLAILGLQEVWLLDPIVISARFVSLNLIPALTYAVNHSFIFLIKTFNLYGGFYDFYHLLKESILGVKVYYFSHSLVIFLSTAALILASLAIARLWCRMLCPLGAGYGLLARWAGLRRRVSAACVHCNACVKRCRMGAIEQGGDRYDTKECILCMDCVYDCPSKAVRFGFGRQESTPLQTDSGAGLNRRQFLFVLLAGLLSMGAKNTEAKRQSVRRVIRPPAALKEEEFLDRCIRCGNCMKVCITNGLQPCLLESGIEGVWTPHLVPEIGYCEYRCTQCGKVCPTGALKALTEQEKARTKLGKAVIDTSVCIPYAKNTECIVCEEHCPVSEKAIKLEKGAADGPSRPYVDPELCVGCGICQSKCPVRPVRAIRVEPL